MDCRRWFDLFSRKIVWKIQQLLHIPFLNFFPNLQRYDACLQILPSHDVVFERNGLYNSGIAMACKKLSLPYVMFFDADQIAELDFMDKPLKGLLRWRAGNLLRYNLDVARRIICVSEIAKKHLDGKMACAIGQDRSVIECSGRRTLQTGPETGHSNPNIASSEESAASYFCGKFLSMA